MYIYIYIYMYVHTVYIYIQRTAAAVPVCRSSNSSPTWCYSSYSSIV